MNSIILLILCLSLFLSLRSLSFAMTYISIYGYRDRECIERIRHQQKACDILNASYHIFVIVTTMCLSAGAIMRMFDVGFVQTFDIASSVVISVCFVVFFVLKYKLEFKYDLRNFYNHMTYYRSLQKVVTEDNDHEVSFIRGYEKTMKHKIYANLCFLTYFIFLLLSKIYCI
jgi:hypothetical protein